MRRNRTPPPPTSPFRALAHHTAGGQAGQQHGHASVSSLIRSFNVEENPTRPMRPSPLTASTIRDMPLDLVDRIRSFPLFMSAPEDFLVAIGAHLRPQIHSAHDHILTEGDDAKAMYWLVRGVVAVTSRDGEAVYAELKPGAFFGEIGILMNMPRTATIVARTKCLLVVLKKEDLQAELPKFPAMEKDIRDEARERLAILNKKRQENGQSNILMDKNGAKVAREAAPGEVSTGETGMIKEGLAVNTKKRKSPSPDAIEDPINGSALASGYVNIRNTLKELPLFSTLPPDALHLLGLSAQPKTYQPFTDIIRQGTPGNEIYFIVRGEAEVIHEMPSPPNPNRQIQPSYTRPRLKQGQYFGEVSSLGLSEGRTATVRSITVVECLMVGGDALEELWKRCPPEIKSQVEETAKQRYQLADDDVEMSDELDAESHALSDEDEPPANAPAVQSPIPQVTFTTPSIPPSPTKPTADTHQPSDPDPYLSMDMENLRNRRRNSLAPPTPQSIISNALSAGKPGESNAVRLFVPPPSSRRDDSPVPTKRARIHAKMHGPSERPELSERLLVAIFKHLDLEEMIRLRIVCRKWRQLLTTSPKLCTHLNLSTISRKVNDWSLENIICPFVGTRPIEIDISNCFHITDEGFKALWSQCGRNVKIWKMKSVWDVSAAQILEMSENAKGLEEVDWSNCRKVGDNLLARVVGWVVPEPVASRNVVISNSAAKGRRGALPPPKADKQSGSNSVVPAPPPPGTVIGCPRLRRLNLSYCKHITDRSMAHLAAHASKRLQSLSLTRCTSITDAGFQTWAPYRFTELTHLCLADCTYLSDNSIIALVNAAKNLTHLDLSFCCALSDTATEVVALGLPLLRELRLAFCGSAVSDESLGCIALHLNELRGLSVRGCVRVTGKGVENVLEGCGRLEWVDVSQCKNLGGWLHGGGVGRWGFDERAKGGKDEGTWKIPGVKVQGGKMGAGGVGGGIGVGMQQALGGMKIFGPGPVMRPVVPPRGVISRRTRKPVRFVVEKGSGGLR